MYDRNKAVYYAAKTFCIFVNFMFNHKKYQTNNTKLKFIRYFAFNIKT